MVLLWLDQPTLYDLFPDGTFITDTAVDHYLNQAQHDDTSARQPL